MTDKPENLEADFLLLAKVALSGRPQDVQLAVHRAAKRYRQASPHFSDELATLLRSVPSRGSPLRRQTEAPLPVDLDSRLQLMRVEEHPALDHEPILHKDVAKQLGRIIKERRNTGALEKAGLQPTRTALFTGLPGVGKTMAARWIARELGKPLLILDLAAVMSSFLGRTGTNLRHVLDYAKSLDCVLLLDELDAIAKRRDDKGEIGELKRLVTVLLQQIDDWPASGLLIAATNHGELLDPAVWRRFEAVITFPLPDAADISKLVLTLLSPHTESGRSWAGVLGIALKGQSFSDIERGVLTARRSAAVMENSLDAELLSLVHAENRSKSERIALATALVDSKLVSQRQAKQLTGVSRDTIRNRASQGKPSGQRASAAARTKLRLVK
ncbi:MAG: AAA family ATPase [Hyphomicrobiaceae bacterium]